VLVETTMLRRKATAKLPDTRGWLFTDEALQQSTAAPVAAYRAARLAGLAVHDVTCSIGTELAALQQTASMVVGSDVDPVRLAMARHNLGLGSGAAGRVLLPTRRAGPGAGADSIPATICPVWTGSSTPTVGAVWS
jgi:predicted RNA methylase